MTGPKLTAASARLYVLVASAARTAVVLRRGPSKQVRMYRWDLERDALEPGQWLSGRIYPERCGLSPNGQLFVYFAGKFDDELGTFTAVCRPPYFTALALWPDGSTWGGGGFFEGDRRLILRYAAVIPELDGGRGIPPGFEVDHAVAYHARHGRAETPESSQGWSLVAPGVEGEPDAAMRVAYAEPQIHAMPNPAHPKWSLERHLLGRFEPNGPASVHSYRLVQRGAPGREPAAVELGRLDWAGWDLDGALLFSERGCLFRQVVAGPRGKTDPVLVADLRADTFQNIRAPDAARRWP